MNGSLTFSFFSCLYACAYDIIHLINFCPLYFTIKYLRNTGTPNMEFIEAAIKSSQKYYNYLEGHGKGKRDR